MASIGHVRATLDDLHRHPGKAELVNGRIIEQLPTGDKPGQVGGNIYASLRDYSKSHPGTAYPDNVGYTVPELPSGRESFSPDASYYNGLPPANRMRFIEGTPRFGAEVRSDGPAAEASLAEKRADYFAAGAEVIWDVDPEAEEVHVYRRSAPDQPVTYRRGQVAEARPALPGWRLAVDDVFWVK